MTIVEQARAITGGVDTHADTHVAAVLDPIGGLLGVQEFPATPAGYARAVERTIPLQLACQAIATCWYATAGHDPADVADHQARAHRR